MLYKPGFYLVSLLLFLAGCSFGQQNLPVLVDYEQIITGAQSTTDYLPILKNKKVAVVANQASLIENTHLVDSLLSLQIKVVKIFSPEHGFRGEEAEGQLIGNETDIKTGIPIVSLYGNHKKPNAEDLQEIDLLVFDLQDVGVRFYTYISTLTYVMEACAEKNIPVILLDRPNPNGFYVDGPILEKEFSSFVGLHPVPIVYGMTIGEYALMLNGEKWLKNGINCDLTVIELAGYEHNMIVKLPIKPSPNLPNWQSVYLYPSLCLFEGTVISVGRGTDFPFQVFGHPDFMIGSFLFTPKSISSSPNPKFKNIACYGQYLSSYAENYIDNPNKLNLFWLFESFKIMKNQGDFFTNYFDKLAGTDKLRKQIEAGLNESEIRKTWENGLNEFTLIRDNYLIYK